MLQLDRVARHQRKIGSEIGACPYVPGDELVVQQSQRGIDNVIDVDRLEPDFAFLQQAAESMDDFAGAVVLADDVVEDFHHLFDVRRVPR